jgi:ATP-binding cassette subfamily F protein 3
MLNVNNISIYFSGVPLLNDISFSVNKNDRVGLIGRNGSGKTTLLNIIAGKRIPDGGTISFPKSYTIGFLPQELNIQSNNSVFEEVQSSLKELEAIKKQIQFYEENLSQEIDEKAILTYSEKINELHYRFDILGGNSIEAEIEQTLTGLGFIREEFSKPMGTFSGGWRMRVELAKILLAKPDLIMLDEPTNHLDIESLIWLEKFLSNYFGSIILVSHDTKFLNNVTNRTIEISNKRVYDFKLPYYRYLELREKQLEEQKSAFNTQQKEIERVEKFISKFRYKSTLASRVQSRIKQLEKIDRIEIDEPDLNNIELRFPPVEKSSLNICEAINLSKFYDSKLVLNELNFQIHRGDKIAFVGKNGEGKTTLAKILAMKENYSGKLYYGNYLQFQYFSQMIYEDLDLSRSILDEVESVAVNKTQEQIRNVLGAFLFQGDDIYKKIKVLSGGEKSRVALAKIVVQPTNFLIMDEPTNHLDVFSKAILKDALMNYDGTLIIVSHDREFLTGLTEQVWEIKNHKLNIFLGDINYYLEKNDLFISSNSSPFKEVIQEQIPLSDAKEQINIYEIRKSLNREIEKIQKNIIKIEQEIQVIEAKIQDFETQSYNPVFFNDIENYLRLQQVYTQNKKKLNELYLSWETEHQLLEEKNNDLNNLT